MLSLKAEISLLQAAGQLALPLPGQGATAARHQRLCRLGHRDLSLARIAEAHTDAIAILAEAGAPLSHQALYGVWASDGPASRVRAEPVADTRWRLSGVKQFCSGATFLDAALVTAHAPTGLLLFDVSLRDPNVHAQASSWRSAALADTATVAVEFAAVEVDARHQIGAPHWYLRRPGFWHGAVGPAACWAGGALSLIDSATALGRRDPHSRAQVGALQALGWGLHALLEQSGREIDSDPHDCADEARVRALKVRHLVERSCTEVLDRFGRATGPQLLAHDEQVAANTPRSRYTFGSAMRNGTWKRFRLKTERGPRLIRQPVLPTEVRSSIEATLRSSRTCVLEALVDANEKPALPSELKA